MNSSVMTKEVIQHYNLYRVRDPVAFKKRGETDNKNSDGKEQFNRVVIFTESAAGHFNNDVFHAFQVIDKNLFSVFNKSDLFRS